MLNLQLKDTKLSIQMHKRVPNMDVHPVRGILVLVKDKLITGLQMREVIKGKL